MIKSDKICTSIEQSALKIGGFYMLKGIAASAGVSVAKVYKSKRNKEMPKQKLKNLMKLWRKQKKTLKVSKKELQNA